MREQNGNTVKAALCLGDARDRWDETVRQFRFRTRMPDRLRHPIMTSAR